jgi:hypothetical protein
MLSSFWIERPPILFENADLGPKDTMDSNEKLNSITRTIFLLTLLGFAATRSAKMALTGIITLGAIVILWLARRVGHEGFENSIITPEVFTEPTVENPLMNVLPSDSPDRPRAAPSFDPVIEAKINQVTKEMVSKGDEEVKDKLFGDLGDEVEFRHSMRAWHPSANTQIPNDQEAFLKFCFKK